MIEYIEGKAVTCQCVAHVIAGPKRPVFPQPFGRENEDTFIPQFVAFYDGQRFEGLTKSHAVGDDATAPLAQFADGSTSPLAGFVLVSVP